MKKLWMPYRIVNEPVYVYSSNSGTSKIINAYPVNSVVKVVYEVNGWYKLLNTGWILRSSNIILDEDLINKAKTEIMLAAIEEEKNKNLSKEMNYDTIVESVKTDEELNESYKTASKWASILTGADTSKESKYDLEEEKKEEEATEKEEEEESKNAENGTTPTNSGTSGTTTQSTDSNEVQAESVKTNEELADKYGLAKDMAEYVDKIVKQIQEVLTSNEEETATTSAIARIGGYNILGMRGVFGLPYQFDWTVDTKLLVDSGGKTVNAKYNDSEGISMDNTKFGRKYMEMIATRAPLLILQAGNPSFLGDLTAAQKTSVASAVWDAMTNKNNKDTISEAAGKALMNKITGIVNNGGKYYSFREAYENYYAAVNSMCRGMAALIGLGDKEVPYYDDTKLSSMQTEDTESIDSSEVKPGKKLYAYHWRYARDGFQMSNYEGSVAFYVNADANVSETFSNGTRESALKGQINQISQMAQEAQFLMGSIVTDIPIFGSAVNATGQAGVAESGSSSSETSGLIGTLIHNIDTLIAGGRMVFPQIWADSTHTKQYAVTIKLDSPDCDNFSIYMNILVPLAHIIGMIMPRRAGDNAYVAPFIVRAFYKSMFHIDMGIITSCTIVRGDVQAWNQSGLPTQVTVSLEIKDLYECLTMSAGKGFDDMLSNPQELDFLANLCGINMAESSITRTFTLWKALRNPATALVDKYVNTILKVKQIIYNLHNKWFGKET